MSENDTTNKYKGIEKVDPRFIDYRNLGGFLLFIVVVCYINAALLFIEALYSLSVYITAIHSLSESAFDDMKLIVFCYMFITVILSLVSIIIYLKIAVKIRERRQDFLFYIQITSLVSFFVMLSVFIVALVLVPQTIKLVVGVVFVNYSFVWLLMLVLCSLYFSHSKRVGIYMGSDQYLRLSLFNRYTVSPLLVYEEFLLQEKVKDSKKRTENPLYDEHSQWLCPVCYTVCDNSDVKCSSCGEKKPAGAVKNRWRCQKCDCVNLGTVSICKCGADKEHFGIPFNNSRI